MVAALILLLAASAPGSTSDFANRILSIEERTGARIGVAALNTADANVSQGRGSGIPCLNFADARIARWI